MQRIGQLIIGIICAVLCSCEGTSFNSSVPRYPVNLHIDTRQGVFVHFQPTAINTYVIADKEGYHYNGSLVVRTVLEACGYAGVVVYIDTWSNYNAWDLACPYCAGRGLRRVCEVDGIFARCPDCGEEYDLGSGTAVPTKKISHEYMRRIPLTNSGGVLVIRQ